MSSRTRPTWGVGVGEKAGVHLHHAGVEAALLRRQAVPRRHPRGPFGELGAGGQQTRCRLPRVDLLAPCVPPLIEAAAVGLDEGRRRLVRRVAGARGEVEQERLVGPVGAQVLDVADRAIGQILGEVVAFLGRTGRRHLMVVVDQIRVVLVRLAGEEAVEALEALAEGPAMPRPAERHLSRRRQMPLAECEGGVAVAHQGLGEEAVLGRDGGVVSREARGELDDARHATGVVVAPGQQAGARRRAQCRGVEVRVTQPARRQAIEGGRGDVRAIAAELGVADVVEENEDDVRRAGGRLLHRRPRGLRVRERTPDHPVESSGHVRLPREKKAALLRPPLERGA